MGAPGTTPGPWSARLTKEHEIGVYDDPYWMVLSDDEYVNEGDSLICSVNTLSGHDAHQIAASPALYDALAKLVPDDFDEHPDDFMPEWHEARAALALARGEQPK